MRGWTVKATGSSAPVGVDVAEVRRALAVLADPEHGVELRALPSARYSILKGGDLDELCRAAERLGDEAGLYYTLNPIPPGLAHRARVGDVVKRRWLLLDFDPVKPDAHKDDSATDAEKQHANALAEVVMDWLTEQGWPPPLLIDSGNGFHELYRLDLPSTPHTHALLKRFIYELAKKFDADGAKVDRSVHNAGRVAKLPGSTARKGVPSKDRPHRPVRLLHVPENIQVVSAELIAATFGEAPAAAPTVNGAHGPADPFKVRAASANASGDNGRAYARAALDGECGRVALAKGGPADGRNNALNRAAFAMGSLIAAGAILRQEVEDALFMVACRVGLDQDAGCGERGIRGTIASGIDAGMKEPRAIPEKKRTAAAAKQEKSAAGDGEWQFTVDGEIVAEGTPSSLLEEHQDAERSAGPVVFSIYSLPGLMQAQFPAPTYVVEGLLSEGLNILAGSPKTGKSMLALNLAMTIAGGGLALKSIQVEAGDVLYLALEDTARRVQARARKMLKGMECGASSRFKVSTRWPNQESGGLQMLDLWIKSCQRPTLVIVDVWGKFRPEVRSNGGPQYEQDCRHLGAVKDYLDDRKCNSLVLMHTRKAPSDDEMHMISGTQGLGGVADGAMVLKRTRGENEAKVFHTGRDIVEGELALQFDPDTLTWKSLGPSAGRDSSKIKAAIMEVFRQSPGGAYWPSELADLTSDGKTGEQLKSWKGVVRGTLLRMESEGLLCKKDRGEKYTWPVPNKPPETEAEF